MLGPRRITAKRLLRQDRQKSEFLRVRLRHDTKFPYRVFEDAVSVQTAFRASIPCRASFGSMRTISVTRTTNLPRTALWTVLSKFPDMAGWSSNVKFSKATTKATAGVGAERHCDFAKSGYVKERVSTWDEGTGYFVDFIDTDAPMKNSGAGFRLVDTRDGGTEATFTIKYEMKMGLLGKLMDVLMVRKQLAKNGATILADLDNAARKIAADPAAK